uniref:ATP synthase complex subunit 8 n=1 Tax=Ochthebius colveranus TaxID=723409 RepID=A0A7H0DLA3_9COLE|nr:ATP synthase F0 subunit 8 [Ochthebius colveranus]
MPQMMPLNWLMLFFFFSLVFMMINSLNYFSFLYQYPSKKSLNFKMLKINWKW